MRVHPARAPPPEHGPDASPRVHPHAGGGTAERLPDAEIQSATRYLEFLTGRDDSYLLYLMSVPEEEEELSEEGRRLLDEGPEDIEPGRLIDSDEAERELGL